MAIDVRKTEQPKGKESPVYTFAVVCRSEELPEGEVRQLKARGKEIAVGRVAGGQLFAVGGRCTHLRGRMGKGTLRGTVLECPWHGAQFDVTDGCIAKWVQHPGWLKLAYEATLPAFMKRALPTYEVKEENGEVLVAVD
jgi:nitrite reductase/ring-hydroxylating ferredoxin subunit